MGLHTFIFTTNCSPLFNIKGIMFYCIFHPNNAAGVTDLFIFPESISWNVLLLDAKWPQYILLSFLPLLIKHLLPLFPCWNPKSPFLSLALASHLVLRMK